ncbi:exodeoxyribonuclease VII large subunit [Campylobacter sp. MIT 21-1685]|uniref:exodeoxyribonuclease VII large subunit n=1 Tax=unclassified Campylobacter TaxID=2593542 RepID=UPI00224B2E1E|nr:MULTISPECIES: exodeoxyribonuclease VII large subunit [unclassified Campylobacter]MCX2683016.1 exodeoxyribonuclease VII large subunit [Campylobacter sp. MIT 21-1684]MCX2751298.1 exodeoxyribonuclease VII large subunit [Campylobacter sp. MIT 21-1682]MCX2807497.1 exodeoxyribonuclease VII large subunit [Campylobacter sp. MIT 21-1685]
MTPTELNLKAKTLLETHFNMISLTGELSKITLHSSGHWYFELKDEKSSIACVMFKSANLKLHFKPLVGDLLELEGTVTLYEQSGRYQFVVSHMQKAGCGDLEAKFLALKETLEREGLFEQKHKKPLPQFPTRIGIITSNTSAALQDMLKLIVQKEYFLATVFIFNSLTQGLNAPNSLINAIRKADKFKLDVLILARGGGSREDLFCFNDEALARTIFSAQTPIISAIGHEIDYVISDFVADLRAPTPSAAIDMLLYSKLDLEQNLDFIQQQLDTLLQRKFTDASATLSQLQKIYQANALPLIIGQKIAFSKNLEQQMQGAIQMRLQKANLELEKVDSALLQHNNFFEKSKDLITLTRKGVKVSLEQLQKGDRIILNSFNSQKRAEIL